MAVLKLTDLAVQSLKPGLYYDERTPAFGIRVGARRKTWLIVKGASRTQVTLGHYPALSLSEARKRALVALGSPLAPKKSSLSFPEALDAFLALPRWRPRTLIVMKSSLKHFTWKRAIDKITHEDVATALEAIKAPSARAHAFHDLRTFFNWCVPRYLSASPCVGIKMERRPSRDRVLSDDELVRVWKAADGTLGTIIRLLVITGQRKSEISTLKWEYVDGDSITLPASVTKNGRAHTFPIGTLAQSLLPSKETGYVFPATHGDGPYSGWSKHIPALLEASGTSGWTIHDLRRTFATNLAALGVPIQVTEKLLNHVSGSLGGVAGIYNRHAYFEEMKEAITLYEAHLQSLFKEE